MIHIMKTTLRELREELGLTQAEAAAELCVDPSTFSRWENHSVVPAGGSYARLHEWAQARCRRLKLPPIDLDWIKEL